MTHTFLERYELVPVIVNCVEKGGNKEIVNRTSVKKNLTISFAHFWGTASLACMKITLLSSFGVNPPEPFSYFA